MVLEVMNKKPSDSGGANRIPSDGLVPSYYDRHGDELEILSAHGNYIVHKGGKLLDMNSGYWTVPLGHRDIQVRSQFKKGYYCHLFGQVHPLAADLSHCLIRASGYARVCFVTTGTAAVDTALRMSWQIGDKAAKGKDVLSFHRGFHGTAFVPLMCAGYPYKNYLPSAFTVHNLGDWAFEEKLSHARAAELIAESDIDWESIGTFVFEPIQGVGGIRILHPNAYNVIAKQCRKHGIVIVADEIATGFGRTGTFLASERYELAPDIVCLGKSITNGEFPLAAVLINETTWMAIENSQKRNFGKYLFGDTYAGHPTGCAFARVVFDQIYDDDFLTRVSRKGDSALVTLKRGLNTSNVVKGVRGVGLMIGVELESSQIAIRIQKRAMEMGVFFGCEGSIVTVMPPLSISKRELSKAIRVLIKAIDDF